MTDTNTITLPRSVVEQALEALESGIQYDYHGNPYSDNDAARCVASDALRAALEQPQVEQEPVAYFYTRSGRVVSTEATDALMQQMIGESGRVALYAHPQPPRQPLTDEAEHQCPYPKANPSTRNAWLDGWEAAERAHGIGGEA